MKIGWFMLRNSLHGNSPFDQARKQNVSGLAGLVPNLPGVELNLNPKQTALLRRLLSEPVAFMDSKELHTPDAERILFEMAVEIPDPDVTWYHPVMSELGLQGDSGRSRNRRRGEVMRLSGKQERALFYQFNYARFRARQIQDALGVSEDQPPLRQPTREEAEALMDWGSLADELRAQVAETNVGLVLAMVRRTSLKNVDVADMVSEGNMALLRAIDKFNPDFGFKFSTYACQSILKAFSRLAHKETRLRDRFPMEFDPEMEESGWMNTRRESFEEDCAAEVEEIVRTNRCNLSEVELRVVQHRFGIQTVDGEPSAADREENRPIGRGERRLRGGRMAMGSDRRMTLGEVGQMIGVGKERVRQIQVKALSKIRHELESGFLTANSEHLDRFRDFNSPPRN